MCNNNLFIYFVSAMEFSLPNLVMSIVFFVRLECTHAGDVSFITLSEFSFFMISNVHRPFLGLSYLAGNLAMFFSCCCRLCFA